MTEAEKLNDILSNCSVHTASDLVERGISRMTIKRQVDNGMIMQIARGVYMSPEALDQDNLSLAVISLLKDGVVCMSSAASFHNLGDENPYAIWYGVDRHKVKSNQVLSLSWPHQFLFMEPHLLEIGVETHFIAGTPVKITSAARTVVDFFHYKRRVENEAALRVFSDYLKEGGDVSTARDIAIQLGRNETLEPYFSLADELVESITVRNGQ